MMTRVRVGVAIPGMDMFGEPVSRSSIHHGSIASILRVVSRGNGFALAIVHHKRMINASGPANATNLASVPTLSSERDLRSRHQIY